MRDGRLQHVVSEIAALRDRDADPELEAVKAAIALEDVSGIRLEDADIGPALLDERTMAMLLERGSGAR